MYETPPPPPVVLVLEEPWPPPYMRFRNRFRQLVGPLGRGVGTSQGLYLHRTAQHRNTRTDIHALSGIRTHDPSIDAVENQKCVAYIICKA
jgi:hypothetical protein